MFTISKKKKLFGFLLFALENQVHQHQKLQIIWIADKICSTKVVPRTVVTQL